MGNVFLHSLISAASSIFFLLEKVVFLHYVRVSLYKKIYSTELLRNIVHQDSLHCLLCRNQSPNMPRSPDCSHQQKPDDLGQYLGWDNCTNFLLSIKRLLCPQGIRQGAALILLPDASLGLYVTGTRPWSRAPAVGLDLSSPHQKSQAVAKQRAKCLHRWQRKFGQGVLQPLELEWRSLPASPSSALFSLLLIHPCCTMCPTSALCPDQVRGKNR